MLWFIFPHLLTVFNIAIILLPQIKSLKYNDHIKCSSLIVYFDSSVYPTIAYLFPRVTINNASYYVPLSECRFDV